MIQVFSKARGFGKSKELIDMANLKANEIKGHAVFIDDDKSPMFQLDNKIRFITMQEFSVDKFDEFYGFIGGILASNYDLEELFIDGLTSTINEKIEDSNEFFEALEKLTDKFGVKVYINVNCEEKNIPTFLQRYVGNLN